MALCWHILPLGSSALCYTSFCSEGKTQYEKLDIEMRSLKVWIIKEHTKRTGSSKVSRLHVWKRATFGVDSAIRCNIYISCIYAIIPWIGTEAHVVLFDKSVRSSKECESHDTSWIRLKTEQSGKSSFKIQRCATSVDSNHDRPKAREWDHLKTEIVTKRWSGGWGSSSLRGHLL